MEKIHLDEGLWYIKNFLTQKELDVLKPYCDDPVGWYATMRSHYKNILNKFPGSVPEFEEDGSLNPLCDKLRKAAGLKSVLAQ